MDFDALLSRLQSAADAVPQDELLSLLPQALDSFHKKDRNLNDKIDAVVTLMLQRVHPWLVWDVIDMLLDKIRAQQSRNHTVQSLKYIAQLTSEQRSHVTARLVDIIPVVFATIGDADKFVREEARRVMRQVIGCSGNNDLEPFMDTLMETFDNTVNITEGVERLAGCIFVQKVECPALAVINPILQKGLKERTTETKRKSCLIVDNMCKLVEHPKEVAPFLPEIKPLLEKCAEHISDPEAREVAERALKTLVQVSGDFGGIVPKTEATFGDVPPLLAKALKNLGNEFCGDYAQWHSAFDAFGPEIPEETRQAIFQEHSVVPSFEEPEFVDMEEGQDLYRGEFSLAYGAVTLLNNTKLHLKRNRFYGLLGPNNCGKTTLMRAIAREQIEGFPKKDELRTIFVEHEIVEREVGEDDKGFPILNIDLNGIDWVIDCCNNVYEMQPPVTREQVEAVMEEIGFGNSLKGIGSDRAADAAMGVTTYSGGWKMKMQLCAATLMNADILMLDEPTGHLDVRNIAWLKEWLNSFMSNGGSIISTSHDSAFLDEMCTHIIDFQNRKLRTFKGERGQTLRNFVDKYPEKRGYFELKNDVTRFVFPEPGPLEGVKSLTRTILQMNNVTYQYPIRDKPTIMDVSLDCSRASRVAVIGANGAGKSTAIKILIGELAPTSGTIWKHPNLRIAYVAQHAFQHLEKHVNKTPVQYIMWRFAGNEDKESVENLQKRVDLTRDETDIVQYCIDPRDPFVLKKCHTGDEMKKAVQVDAILARRENKKQKTKEYEVRLKNSVEHTLWVPREVLIQMGYLKMVQRHDEKEAAMAGLMLKPLTTTVIERYLADFGIDAEQASHTLIGSLSGGQKVKVVLAASLWQNPHLIILDEPTNYLDRDGLGALTLAIQEFQGGVIIISHNREFANAVATEKWIMEAGRLRREGAPVVSEEEKKEELRELGAQTVRDAFGNEIQVEGKMSAKEIKAKIKNIQKSLKQRKKMTEDEVLDLEEELQQLQEKLAEVSTK